VANRGSAAIRERKFNFAGDAALHQLASTERDAGQREHQAHELGLTGGSGFSKNLLQLENAWNRP